jgi:DNA-binding LacI/PurR family transcriptional regulator
MNTNNSARVKKSEHSLLLLNPVATLQFRPLPHAKRLKDLNNKKIGLYWNYKAQGDVALNRVKELLSERFQGMSFEWFMTGSTEEAKQEWLENVRKSGVDGVVATTGD